MRYLVTYVRFKQKYSYSHRVYTDHYEAFIDLDGAMRRWKHLTQQQSVWSANVSKIIESTDYEKSCGSGVPKCPADVLKQMKQV